MDSILNFAQQQLSGHNQQQNQQQGGQFNNQQGGQFNQQGGQQYNQQGQQGQSAGFGGAAGLMGLASQFMGSQGGNNVQGGSHGGFDFSALLAGANQQHGNADQLQGQMQQALGAVQSAQNPNASVDENQVLQAHNEAYNQGNAGQMTANSMGAAAAIQAFKSFAQGGNQQATQGAGEQSLISKLLGMAMAEAVKLFNKSGGTADGGSQQDVMSSAGSTLMKLLVQNQVKGALGGGTASGPSSGGPDLNQLMGLASKFLK